MTSRGGGRWINKTGHHLSGIQRKDGMFIQFEITFCFKFRVNCPCKYNFSDDGKKVTPRRDVPNYPKVCSQRWTSLINIYSVYWDSHGFIYPAYTVHTVSGDCWSSQEANIWCLALGTQRGLLILPLHNHNFHTIHVKDVWRSLPLWLQMLSCLEYMYHDLGLVKEFNMNPITLKRWLVKLEQW